MTLWKMVGNEQEADAVLKMVSGPLVGAKVRRFSEVETPEMLEIRRSRRDILPGE
jgi:hypothetical protein